MERVHPKTQKRQHKSKEENLQCCTQQNISFSGCCPNHSWYPHKVEAVPLNMLGENEHPQLILLRPNQMGRNSAKFIALMFLPLCVIQCIWTEAVCQ